MFQGTEASGISQAAAKDFSWDNKDCFTKMRAKKRWSSRSPRGKRSMMPPPPMAPLVQVPLRGPTSFVRQVEPKGWTKDSKDKEF